jgi:hypothetical protein
MRKAAVLGIAVAMGMVFGVTTTAAEAEPQPEAPAITIRIHDYAGAQRCDLERAQRNVTRTYQRIGVRLTWARTIAAEPGREGPANDLITEDLSIIILNRRMSERRPTARDAMGSAAVGLDGGRIAYVHFERVVDTAVEAYWPLDELLGVVVAHELGHLLLPHGSHSADGVMRAQWEVGELRRIGRRRLDFTEEQAALIRERLIRERVAISAGVAAQ